MYQVILEAFWFILPAYFANSMPVNVSKTKSLMWLGKPIDGGAKFRGARVLGDGKTWRGLVFGVGAAVVCAFLQTLIEPALLETLPFLPHMSVPLGFALGCGALFGDMAASFVKRQMNMTPGSPAPLLDQLDFVFGAMFFAWIMYAAMLGRIDHVFEETISYRVFYALVIMTPLVHLVGNLVAWVLKLKKKPW